jgi:hypothetical protein
MFSTKFVPMVAGLACAFATAAASAAPIMPDFSTVPAGWTTDRYDPASFSNVGPVQGRNDVLGIGIDASTNLANRTPGYQSTFYNTQGKAHVAAGGAGSVLAADLYIPEAWRDAANGHVRTDLWAVATNAVNAVSAYGIIGFTNYGGTARLRVYDEHLAGFWFDVGTPVDFNDWTSLAVEFTGSALEFSVNGALVYTDATIGGTTGFGSVIMQAYNFADPAIAGANPLAYTANWSNTMAAEVPEPGTLALFGLGMLGFGALRRKAKRAA